MESSCWLLLPLGNVLNSFFDSPAAQHQQTDTAVRTTSSCRRIEPVQYTEHLDKACKTLTELQEYESDVIIFPLVSVQNVVLKISTAFTDPNLGLSTVPVKMFIKSLHSELESIKEGMSVEAAEDCK